MNRLFSLFSNDDFNIVKVMIENLCINLPPEYIKGERGALSVNKITRTLERAVETARGYQKNKMLGIIKRSIMANEFKWELRNRGYPETFVNTATEVLIVEMSKASASKAKGKP